MIKGTSEELTKLIQTHQCPEHPDRMLNVLTQQDGTEVVNCGAGHFPEEVVVRKVPARRVVSPVKESLDFNPQGLPGKDLGTGEALGVSGLRALVAYAERYGLDAWRGHVMIMHGKPYIGLDGYLYHAYTHGWTYQLRSRPLDEGERKSMQLEAFDHGWKAEITLLPSQAYFVGIGIVTKKEMEEPSKKDPSKLAAPVVAAHPWQLAQKRAEWQALRRAFPIGEENGPPPAGTPPVPAAALPPRDAEQDIKDLWPQ